MSKSDYAVRVEGLGKQYRLGLQQAGGMYRYKSLRDSLGGFARNPLAAARALAGQGPMTEENSFWALKDVSFDIKKGEVVGIIGRNGAGKSTLLKILSRITKPTTGRIDLYGRVGSLLEVGTGFHPELSGRENIFLNGAILGMTQAEVKKQFDEIVAFSEIEKFLDTPVKQYSSGMYMRLAFAVAANLSTDILVVDEVLAVGDAAFQARCLGKMHDVATQGRTVLFVSHNMGAVRRMCARAIMLSSGKLMHDDLPDAVINSYFQAPADAAADQPQWHRMGGSGELVLTACKVSKHTYDPDEPKRIIVQVEKKLEIATPAHVIIEIFNSVGERLLKSDSRHVQRWIQNSSTKSECVFEIRHPWFSPGQYRVDLSIAAFGRVDAIEDAARFSVNDVFPYVGTGAFTDLLGLDFAADFSVEMPAELASKPEVKG